MNKLSIPERHQLNIAKRTVFELSDIGALVLGGPSKRESVAIIQQLGSDHDKARVKREWADLETFPAK
jgi:hypothetical protein